MGKFDGYLICSDIDGTFSQDEVVSPRSLEAYWEIFPIRPNAPVISANGTIIVDGETGRTLWTFPLDGCGNLLEWLDGSVGKVNLHYLDGHDYVRDGKVSEAYQNRTCGDLMKIVCFGFPGGDAAIAFRDEARRIFGSRYDIVRSWELGVEFTSPLAGKGTCLNYIRQLCEDVHTVIAVGDYENDCGMLRAADRAFAPANACPEVLALNPTVVCSCAEGALADVIEGLEASLI